MSKENEVIEDVVDVPDVEVTTDDEGNDTTDWKAIAEANRELALKNQGIARRYKTKAEKAKDAPPPIEKKEPADSSAKSDDFSSGDKALLRSYDIKGADEMALAKTWMKRTGDDIDVMAVDDIFQAKLKTLREVKASADAIPKGNKRSTAPASNDEAYWSAKIESGQAKLADIEDVQMRRKVLNARVEKEKSGSKFSQKSVVMT